MFNEYIFVQISIIIILFFLFWLTDIYNLLIISFVYLLLISLLTLYLDIDILISFLIIIDLGVFLILFAFLLHLSKFLTFKNIYDLSFKNIFIFCTTLTFLLIYNYCVNFYTSYNFNKIIEFTWFFFISYMDFYYIWNTVINSDMHLLKEIYFHTNSIEFIIISIFLTIGILVLYFLLNFIIIYILKCNLFNNINLKKLNKNTSITFFKIQNYTKQINTSASSRVWTKIKHDFKTNNNISNR